MPETTYETMVIQESIKHAFWLVLMTTSSTSYTESEYFTIAALFMLFTILDIPPPPEPPVPTLYPTPFPTHSPPLPPPPPPPTSTFSPLPPFQQLPPFTPSTTRLPPRPSQPEFIKWLRFVAIYILAPTTIITAIALIAKYIRPQLPPISVFDIPERVKSAISCTDESLPIEWCKLPQLMGLECDANAVLRRDCCT